MAILAMRVYNTLVSSASFGNLAVLDAVLASHNGTATTIAQSKSEIYCTYSTATIIRANAVMAVERKYLSYKLLYGTAVQKRVA